MTSSPYRFLTLLVLPVLFLAVEVYLRSVAGPFWQWNLLDPAYFYLLDALNLLGGNPPGHVAHPGITVDTFGAVVIWLTHFGADGFPVAPVLAQPESQLAILSTAYLALNAIVLAGLGGAAYRVFGGLIPALACQLAPFASTIVLKHAFLPKPEAMLTAVTMVFIAACLFAARHDRPVRAAIALGAVAGFGLATKVTIVPIFVLGLFVLPNVRAMVVYGVATGVAFFVFFLPGIGGFHIFADWMAHVAMGAGAHGAGPQTIIELDYYPTAVAKILKRPALKVPLILAVLTLTLAAWRRRGVDLPGWEIRLLLGISVAQACHVLFVAKQPAAFYLIPSYMLAAPSVVLAARLLWRMRPSSWRVPVSGPALGGAVVAVFAVGQMPGIEKLKTHFETHRENAQAVDNATFEACALVYIYAASSPVFALFLADRVTGQRHSEALAKLYPGDDYWIEDWYDQARFDFRNWQGTQDFAEVRASHSCMVFRGNRVQGLRAFLKGVAPDIRLDANTCAAPPETVATLNVDCDGTVTP